MTPAASVGYARFRSRSGVEKAPRPHLGVMQVILVKLISAGRGYGQSQEDKQLRWSSVRYPSDTTDAEWAVLAPHVPAGTGCPIVYPAATSWTRSVTSTAPAAG